MATERYRKNSIATLQLSDGTVSLDHGEIAKEFLVAFKGRMGTVKPILLGNEYLTYEIYLFKTLLNVCYNIYCNEENISK